MHTAINSFQLISSIDVSVFDISEYSQQPAYNPQQQQFQSYPPSQPHPPQNEQLQQGHPPHSTEQSYPQMAPPPYSEQAQTTQPMPYTANAQQPTVMQPTNSQSTTVVVAGGVMPVSIFLLMIK